MKAKVFLLYECCIPVKGFGRSIICDLQRNSFHFIPNGLLEILIEMKGKPTSIIKKKYKNKYDDLIDEYFNFLVTKEYGFWCENPKNFPPIDFSFYSPEIINNAIIDINKDSTHNYEKIFNELFILRCKYLEIRIYSELDLIDLNKIISLSKKTALSNIDIFLKYSKGLSVEEIFNSVIEGNTIIGNLVIHSSPFDKTYEDKYYRIKFIKQQIINSNCCGNISLEQFTIDIPTFTETLKYNNCLNKKISVDVNGNIKNCPSMRKVFGNITKDSLVDIVNNINFKEVWSITKDKIQICSDCEFRYICSDCRAFIQDRDNLLSKPLKCGYDPYTNVWKKLKNVDNTICV